MSKRPVPDMQTADSSSDDDAPEELSATEVRKQSVSQLKTLKEAERRIKDEEKERRRKRNELFKTQKVKKNLDLSSRKLPQDILDAVSTKSNKGNQSDSIKKRLYDNEDNDVNERLLDSGLELEDYNSTSDFIPFGDASSSKLRAVTEDEVHKKKLSSAQAAFNFKNSRLYNQQTIPRESAQQRRARAAKRQANKIR
ncbi:unnamed protein product [Lymnaea stagnalis]|uniref:Nucleolar protein 7 n=1 Tax=Lymnaea stagnalis TaxID=6523 RepID=A0AAV2HCL0_LYMST